MSLEIKKKIILNTNNSRPNDRVIIKKGSIKTIILEVTINDKGGVLELPLGTTAKVRMRKPDGKQVLNDCTVNGNTVNVEVTEQMQTSPGDGECEVILFHGQGTLTSATFPIAIERNVHDDSQLESLPEYNTLINALVRIEDAVPKAEQAYEVAMEAQEIVDNIQNEFTQMQTVNANAVNAANTAATNANGKATLANNAADIANTKASAANTAATNANNAADSANSAATNASSMAELAETAGSNANSIANTIEQKLLNGEFDGTDGVSPSITVKTNTGTTYVLEITDAENTITTPNLRGKDGTGAGDMTSSVYDPQGKAVDVFEYIDGVATQLNEDVDTWRGNLIVDNLASELTDKALSAKQGFVLDEKITTLNESLIPSNRVSDLINESVTITANTPTTISLNKRILANEYERVIIYAKHNISNTNVVVEIPRLLFNSISNYITPFLIGGNSTIETFNLIEKLIDSDALKITMTSTIDIIVTNIQAVKL
nr:MAG TPA: Baseplate component [Bacteriophage sp.]